MLLITALDLAAQGEAVLLWECQLGDEEVGQALGKGFAAVGSDSGLEPCLLQEMGFQLQHVTVALDNQNQ